MAAGAVVSVLAGLALRMPASTSPVESAPADAAPVDDGPRAVPAGGS
jgi:hypothetical protein